MKFTQIIDSILFNNRNTLLLYNIASNITLKFSNHAVIYYNLLSKFILHFIQIHIFFSKVFT